MTDRFTLDTNVLVDAHDFADPVRRRLAETLIRDAALVDCVLTLQSIGELFRALTRKLGATPVQAAHAARFYASMFPTAAPSTVSLDLALDAAEKGRFAFWDAYLLAAAAEAGCATCLSADMHDGAKLGAVTVRRAYDGKSLSKVAQALLLR
jgi:predicted nucleic acid-binding protein